MPPGALLSALDRQIQRTFTVLDFFLDRRDGGQIQTHGNPDGFGFKLPD
jgi:hypothetical protein